MGDPIKFELFPEQAAEEAEMDHISDVAFAQIPQVVSLDELKGKVEEEDIYIHPDYKLISAARRAELAELDASSQAAFDGSLQLRSWRGGIVLQQVAEAQSGAADTLDTVPSGAQVRQKA